MTKGIFTISLISVLMIAVLGIVIGGCKSTPTSSQEMALNPFTVVWGPESERVVTFSGDSAGHVAGEVSEFTIRLDNNSQESWQGEYIVQLLDSDGIVMEIDRDTFDVRSGMGSQIDIQARFDAGLDGPYGLSLYIPSREAQSIQTIWIGEESTEEVGHWPSIASHPWLWPASEGFTEETAQQIAENFVRNSPTFVFDGIVDSLELMETLYPDIENAWQFVFRFDSRHAGYGDRTGQMLAQVITPHETAIMVESGKVKSAFIDEKWDMINQKLTADNP